jgi:hypothetical protein
MLDRCRLADEARQSESGLVAGHGSVRLARDDERVPLLVRALEDAGQKVNPRFDREYSAAEIDRYPFMTLRFRMVGVEGGANFKEQTWDRASACARCGAGARPAAPLRVRPSALGKKSLACTAHDGSLVGLADLARTLVAVGCGGFALEEVANRKGTVDPRWAWLNVRGTWPRVARPDLLHRAEPCDRCERAGHYDCWSRPTCHVYERYPDAVPDVAHTFETYGRWFDRFPGDRAFPVGGAPRIIVSRRVRDFLLRHAPRGIEFEPVFLREDPLIAEWPMSALAGAT